MTPGKHIALEGLAPNHTELLRRLHAELVAAHVPVKLLATSWNSTDLTTQTVTAILEDSRYPKSLRTHSLLSDTTLSVQHEAIRKELANGVHCLSGRGALTSLVGDYYGLGVANDYQAMRTVADFASAGQVADLTIVLDTPATELGSLNASELYLPTHSKPDEALLERMRAGFLWEAGQRGLPVVSVEADTNHTFDQIWQLVADFLGVETAARAADEPHSVAEILAANPPQQTKSPEQSKSFASNGFGQDKPEGTIRAETAAPAPTKPISILASAYIETANLAVNQESNLHYDEKDAAGHYRYYLPAELKGKVRSQYIRTMNQQFDAYTEMAASLKAYLAKTSRPESDAYDILRAVLPLAATTSLDWTENAPTTRAALPAALPETKDLVEAFPQHITSADDQKLVELASDLLPPNFTAEDRTVKLLEFHPRNELDLAANALFQYTDLPSTQLHEIASSWTYRQKVDVLSLYCQLADKAALGAATYSFDLITPYVTLQQLVSSPCISNAQWQIVTPRLGYEVPRIIEEAGLSDYYEACFDRSLELFSALHAAKGLYFAQYATLQGSKVRWTCTISALEFAQLNRIAAVLPHEADQTQPVQQMFEAVAEIHPLLAETIATDYTASQT